jgi:tellurite resistance protein TerC
MSAEYFACDLSNLFVLLFIVSRFATPRIAQQKVLLFGIVQGSAARTGFIFGARRASGRPDAEATADGHG